MTKEAKNHFDDVAVEWDAKTTRMKLTCAVANALKKMCKLSPDMQVLEYGCGTGSLSILIAENFKQIVVVDSSKGMIAELEKKLVDLTETNITPFVFDLTCKPALNTKFDLIITVMTLHHIQNIETIFVKFLEMLAVNGEILIVDLCKEDGSFHSDIKVPHNGFDLEKLILCLKSLGFNNCQTEIIHTIKKNNVEYNVFALLIRQNSVIPFN